MVVGMEAFHNVTVVNVENSYNFCSVYILFRWRVWTGLHCVNQLFTCCCCAYNQHHDCHDNFVNQSQRKKPKDTKQLAKAKANATYDKIVDKTPPGSPQVGTETNVAYDQVTKVI